MPNWTTIVSTGHNEGRAYNLLGTNLTESPTGPKNRLVGSYYLDFRSLTSSYVTPGATGVSVVTDFSAELTSPEFSVIIADGRDMMPQNVDESSFTDDVDPDEDGESTSIVTYSGVVVPGRPCTLTGVRASVRLLNPEYTDAGVWEAGIIPQNEGDEDGFTNAVITAFQSTLAVWLDQQAQHSAEIDPLANVDQWWAYTPFLRYSLHYAIYVVKLVPPAGGDALGDDLTQAAETAGEVNANDLVGDVAQHEWVPSEGPIGLLAVHGLDNPAASDNVHEWPETSWVRLWNTDPPGHRTLTRGVIVLPYTLPNLYGISPGDDYFVDFEIDGDPVAGLGEQTRPDVSSAGRHVTLNIRWSGEYQLQHDDLVVLHIQTGRAALAAPSPGMTSDEPALIIGSTANSLPVAGPRLSLCHWHVQARSRTT